MVAECERAVELGVPAVAFTEHLDFTDYGPGDAIAAMGVKPGWWDATRPLDVTGYLASVDECRHRFPSLRILSGVEAGEPHLFAGSVRAVLAAGTFDRVLGSLHALPWEGRQVNSSSLFGILPRGGVMRGSLGGVAALDKGSEAFEILPHVDYPRRHWPASAGPYAESDFEEEYRAALRALASSGRVLELNTYSPLASVTLLRWWRDEGGAAGARRAVRGCRWAGRRTWHGGSPTSSARRWTSPRPRGSAVAATRPTSGGAEGPAWRIAPRRC